MPGTSWPRKSWGCNPFGTILEFFTGLPLAWGIGISTLIVVSYTYLGGMWAVPLTDAVQMIILIVGMSIMLAVAVPLVGGWDAIFSNSPDNNLLNIKLLALQFQVIYNLMVVSWTVLLVALLAPCNPM